MTRRVKRHSDFELNLTIKNNDFIKTPRDAQRNWLLNRVLREASDELVELNRVAPTMVRGSDDVIDLNRAEGHVSDIDIMEDWQIPVMQSMARMITREGDNVLEIGMGRAIASDFIQALNPASHTIIECNDSIVAGFADWVKNYPGKNIRLIHSMWQDCLDQLDTYDGIFFHTYPLDEDEFVQTVVNDVSFAGHFMPIAKKLLKPGGKLTYLTNEHDSLSRAHQRLIFEHFSEIKLTQLRNLDIPETTRDAQWVKQTLVIQVTR